MPSLSTKPGGNTRDAKACWKMALNSASRPPIPMSLNLKSGAKMAFGAALHHHFMSIHVIGEGGEHSHSCIDRAEVFEFEVAVDDLFLVDMADVGDELTNEFGCTFPLR